MKEVTSYSMESLLNDLAIDEEQAFNALVRHYRKKLIVAAFDILSTVQDAEDVVQEVFIDFWRRKNSLSSIESLPSYLVTAARYQSYMRIKKKRVRDKRQRNYNYQAETSTFSFSLEDNELGMQIQQAIAALPPAVRNSFTLHYIDGKSHKYIAAEQNIGPQTVKNNISQALKLLRCKLQVLTR